MSGTPALRTAIRAIARNPLRSGLTILGVVIGTAAVIAMVSVGQGADAAVRQQIANLGTNVVMVFPGATTSSGVRSGAGSANTLTVADGKAIAKDCPAVAGVAWVKREVAQVTFGNKNWSTGVQGSPPSYAEVRGWAVVSGRWFTQTEEDGAAKVAVVGQSLVRELFAPGEDPIDAVVRIKNVPFRVLGVLARKGFTSWGQDQDDTVIVPFSTAERRVIGSEVLGVVGLLMASAVSRDASLDAVAQIREVLHARHRIPEGQEDDFTVRGMQEMFETSLEASRVMTQLLLAIASISLLVGGIGIMNTLLVSVTERTREIGVRMAVGARTRDVLFQFLIESTVLSLAGGTVGVAVGIGAARLVSSLAGWPIVVSPVAVGAAFGVSAVVGIVFGVYPARRAARMDPIEALRRE